MGPVTMEPASCQVTDTILRVPALPRNSAQRWGEGGASPGPLGATRGSVTICHLPPLWPFPCCTHTIQGLCLMLPLVLVFGHHLPGHKTRKVPASRASFPLCARLKWCRGPPSQGPMVSPQPETALPEPHVSQKQLFPFPASRET